MQSVSKKDEEANILSFFFFLCIFEFSVTKEGIAAQLLPLLFENKKFVMIEL